VDAIKQSGCQIVGLSGFLTLAYDSMKNTIAAIEAAGLRNQVKIMIGGGQMDESITKHTGANAYGRSAMDAVNLAKEWIGG
jgi:5-methyltetrahydrofolate--homocysteine methyltransferase